MTHKQAPITAGCVCWGSASVLIVCKPQPYDSTPVPYISSTRGPHQAKPRGVSEKPLANISSHSLFLARIKRSDTISVPRCGSGAVLVECCRRAVRLARDDPGGPRGGCEPYGAGTRSEDGYLAALCGHVYGHWGTCNPSQHNNEQTSQSYASTARETRLHSPGIIETMKCTGTGNRSRGLTR